MGSQVATSEIDVLIVGAGPAGMMLALWMARLGINARIVDKRSTKVFSGQADGLQARTLEIFDSFGLGDRVWKEVIQCIEVIFWNPDTSGKIQRDSVVVNGVPGLSRFTESALNQGRIEQWFLDAIRASYPKEAAHQNGSSSNGSATANGSNGSSTSNGSGTPASPSPIRVERCVMPTTMTIDESLADNDDAHPVTVTLRHLSEEEATPAQQQSTSNLSDGLFRSNLAEDDVPALLRHGGTEEVVRCKYVVGCDGAHSWVRKTLGDGFEMEGTMTDYIWGVLDIVPITDFPDIRKRTIIHSASSGSLMVIPRENKLVRLYIQLNEVSPDGGRVDRSKINPGMILKAAQNILSPYTIDYHYCDWWTAYQIGQRVGAHFSKLDRVFLAGDAVHTHSPKAGQGMNTSLQDTFNLGWKLGLACRNIVRRDVLATYELERRMVAQMLIAFDHRFSRLFSGRPKKDIMDETGISPEELANVFRVSHMFTTAIGIRYPSSILAARPPVTQSEPGMPVVEGLSLTSAPSPAQSTPELASACQVGARIPSRQLVNQADARPWPLHHAMLSDGRFRLFVFAGDVLGDPARKRAANALGEWLATSFLPRVPRLPLSVAAAPFKPTPASHLGGQPDYSPVVDVVLVHAAPRAQVNLLRDFHDVYHRFDERLGWDYDRVFADAPLHHHGDGEVYKSLGIDAARGAVVLVRPDGHVGLVTSVEEEGYAEIEKWFSAVLRMN